MDYGDLTGNELDNIDTGSAGWGDASYTDTTTPDLDFGEFGDYTSPENNYNFDTDSLLGNWRDSLQMTTGNPIDYGNTGFLGSGLSGIGTSTPVDSTGFAGISSPQTTVQQGGLTPANISGWGDVVPTDARYENRYGAFGGTDQANTNNKVVMDRYNADPITQGTSFLGGLAKYAGMINPALGAILGLGSTAANQVNRASYGLPNDYSNWGGLVGSTLGGGGIGSAIGGTLGKLGVQAAQGNTATLGDTALNSALKTGGGYLGGLLGGSTGSAIGSALAGSLPNAIGTGYQIYEQNQAANRLDNLAKQAEGDSSYYSTAMRNLIENPDSFKNTGVYRSAYDTAMNEGRRAMAAQGMLGSGGRVAGLAKLANNTANSNYGSYLQNLQNMVNMNSATTASTLAKLAEAAKGRRNTMVLQSIFGS